MMSSTCATVRPDDPKVGGTGSVGAADAEGAAPSIATATKLDTTRVRTRFDFMFGLSSDRWRHHKPNAGFVQPLCAGKTTSRLLPGIPQDSGDEDS